MGIKNFHTWLKETYPKCFISCKLKSVFDFIYVDVNHILHASLNGVLTEQEYLIKLKKNLDLLFCNFIATKKIVLAVDGTSPYAKILLQRSRRQMGIQQLSFDNKDSSEVTSLHLTPGTKFMDKINKCLLEYSNNLKKLYKYVQVEIECIPSTTHSEGEIKIFTNILKNGHKDGNNFKSHLVVGNDADLIVLAMAVKPVEYIYIVSRQQGIQEILSVKKLINSFVRKLSKSTLTSDVWRNDFVILSIMMGNDYMPKLGIIKYDSLWNAYYKTVKHLKKESLIITEHYTHDDKAIKLVKYNDKFINYLFASIIVNIPKQYQKIKLDKYDKGMVKNYLEGLIWCHHMYQTGVCSMLDYIYMYKSAPTPVEIQYYLSTIPNTNDICLPESNTSPIRSDVFPLILMPKKARTLIADKYQHLIDGPLKKMYELEDCEICNKLRVSLSTYHNQLKANSNNKDKKLETTIKINIRAMNVNLKLHKKTHDNSFTIKDIKNIVSLTEKL